MGSKSLHREGFHVSPTYGKGDRNSESFASPDPNGGEHFKQSSEKLYLLTLIHLPLRYPYTET